MNLKKWNHKMRSFKKKGLVFFFFLVFLLVFCSFTYAIGISPADAYVNFVPNHEYVLDYSITSYRPFEFYTEGRFSEYTRIETISHDEKRGHFRLYLTLPETYDLPGKHKLFVAAREKVTPGAVNTIAAIRGYILIDVPYPGHYAEMDVSVNDVNEGDPIPISVVVRNKGKLNISNARVQLTILSDDKVIKTINSESVAINTTGGHTFQTIILGTELKPGIYNLRANLFYEGTPKEVTKTFRVGTFNVEIVNYTRKMFNNSVNPFDIEVESKWNNRMNTVYLDLNIKNGSKVLSTAKTPPFDLDPWEKRKSSFYWNTAGISIGEYDLEAVIHYDREKRVENRKIFIVEKQPPEKETAMMPVSTIILVAIAIILVLFNIYFIIQRKKKKEEKS